MPRDLPRVIRILLVMNYSASFTEARRTYQLIILNYAFTWYQTPFIVPYLAYGLLD
jgi:hypothetical protein